MEDAIRTAVSGFQAPLAFTRADLGALYGALGLIARGVELGEMAYAAGRNQAAVMVLWSTSQLGHLYLLDGQIARAEELIIEANQGASTTDQESLFGGANSLAEAELMLAKNDYARALLACDRLIEYRASHRLRQDLPNVLCVKALALRKNGNVDEAWTLLKEARGEAENTHARWILWRILAALAEIENERGNYEQAQALRAQAREVIAYIVEHTPPELRESFLNVPDVRAVMN